LEELNLMQDTLRDHETRLRTVEQNQVEMKYDLINIKTSQTDLKVMVSEVNQNSNKILNKFVDSELSCKTTNQKNVWSLIFKIWAIFAPVITAVSAYFIGRGN